MHSVAPKSAFVRSYLQVRLVFAGIDFEDDSDTVLASVCRA